MQYLTIHEAKSGSEQFARQAGPRGEFFAFDYRVSHDPTIECVGVGLSPDVEKFAAWKYATDIHTGARIGWEDAKLDDHVRLFCTKLHVLRTRDNPVDTSPQVIRSLLMHFVRKYIAEWSVPIVLEPDWLTSDVVALARGIHADAAFDRTPILADALQDAGCFDPLVLDHLRLCPDHGPSCWVVEMILDQTATR